MGIQADQDIKLLQDNVAHVKTKLNGDVLNEEFKALVLKF